jgi:predicted ATPase/class 3 adenylate cyclase
MTAQPATQFPFGDLPEGTVTFLFTDIEGSTQLLQRLRDRYAILLADQRRILREAFAHWQGHEVDTQGDAFFVAFSRATQAVSAAAEAQRVLAEHAWPDDVAVRVRKGIHTGEPWSGAEGYVGMDVHRAARIAHVGHGGQVLLSETTTALVRDELPPGVGLLGLGLHLLKDMRRPEHISQLMIEGLPAEFPPLKPLETLPLQLTSFVGREREMAEVQRLLAEARLLTLTGAGGSGKTRLALQAAKGLVTEFEDGVWWVELASLSDPALVPQVIGAALGLRDQASRPMLDQLGDHLRAKRLLLVVDNCEHLVAACATCADVLLHAAPGLRILATSREPLAIAGETTYRVPSLQMPDTEHLPPSGALVQFEAVRLFVDRGAAVLPGFAVTQANGAAIAEICRRLDGIPLAIELAAARIKVLPVEELRARLSDCFRVLTGGSRVALPRHRTLRAAMDWSYGLLEEPERVLLRRLAVFAGGWTLETAETACGGDGIPEAEVLDTLAGLVDKSLVILDRSGEGGRYRMLETVRQYATEQLAESGEADRMRQRHAIFFLALAEEAEPKLFGPEQYAWFARLEAEHSNLRTALEWLAAHGEASQGLRLAGALWRFWEVRGHLAEGRAWLAEMLRLARPGADAEARAKALLGAGGCAYYLRDHPAAAAQWEESRSLYRALGNRQGTARVLIYQGWLANDLGHFAEARRLYEEGLAIFREIGDRQGTAWALARLGIAWYWEGDPATGLPLLEQGLALSREINDKLGIAQWTYLRGLMLFAQGDLGPAVALFEAAAPLCRELGDRRDLGFCLLGLGAGALAQGDLEGGLLRFKESLSLFRELGDPMGIAGVLAWSAIASAGGSQPVRALRLGGAAQALDEASGVVWPANMIAMIQQALEATRASLDAEAAGAAWMEGRSMPLEQAIAEALG